MSERDVLCALPVCRGSSFRGGSLGRLFAQSSTGSISGNVVDASGAGVPGASVSVRNVDTGATRAATSGVSGGFTFPNLTPGNYAVSGELSGFSPAKVTNVTVTVGGDVDRQARARDRRGRRRSVTVSSEAPLDRDDEVAGQLGRQRDG